MIDVIRALYKEISYQTMKNNPMVSEEKLLKKMKKFSVRKNFVLVASPLLLFGAFVAPLANESASLASVTLSFVAFVFSFYVSTVHSSHIISMRVFDFFKPLPVKIEPLYFYALLLVDSSGSLAMAVPSAIVLALNNLIQAVLLVLWVFVGIIFGHSLGIIVYVLFGSKLVSGKSKWQLLRSVARVFGMIAFIGAVYSVNYFQDVLKSVEIVERYSLVYPFSAASVVNPELSTLLVFSYLSILVPLNFYALKKLWKEISEPRVKVEKKVSEFSAGYGGAISSLFVKDLRLVFRKTSSLAGLLIPLYVALPQILLAVKTGKFHRELLISSVVVISLFSVVGSDVLLRIEGKNVELLRTLPLRKFHFVVSKILSSSFVPVTSSIVVVTAASYFDITSLLFTPLAVLLPANVSALTMLYLFRYRSEEVGIPEKGLLGTFVLFVANAALIFVEIAPTFFLSPPYGIFLSCAISLSALSLMILMLKRV